MKMIDIEPYELMLRLCEAMLIENTSDDGNWGYPSSHAEYRAILDICRNKLFEYNRKENEIHQINEMKENGE